MGKPFTVNVTRADPYKTYRFLVYFGTSTSPVAAVSKVTGLKRSSDVIDYKEGGNAIILKGLGRTKYEPITLERRSTGSGAPPDTISSIRCCPSLLKMPRNARPHARNARAAAGRVQRSVGSSKSASMRPRPGRRRCAAKAYVQWR